MKWRKFSECLRSRVSPESQKREHDQGRHRRTLILILGIAIFLLFALVFSQQAFNLALRPILAARAADSGAARGTPGPGAAGNWQLTASSHCGSFSQKNLRANPTLHLQLSQMTLY